MEILIQATRAKVPVNPDLNIGLVRGRGERHREGYGEEPIQRPVVRPEGCLVRSNKG